ncbi:MAG: PIG-L family deacetylase [Chloroflexota bacterium]|nr:PIG-L family deacetylase [Chloroflexota bacterium]
MAYYPIKKPKDQEGEVLSKRIDRGQTIGIRTAAVIVAHPDDKTLWAGGTILSHPDWRWTVVALCRRNDFDRAPKFRRALKELGAVGDLGDLDDSPDQTPLTDHAVQQMILNLLPNRSFDLIITHSLKGEYTTHRRHTETSLAVSALWKQGDLVSPELWMFAYDDGGRHHLPQAIPIANRIDKLLPQQWMQKYRLITEGYSFRPFSYEAKTTPKTEAFWCFRSPQAIEQWFNKEGTRLI